MHLKKQKQFEYKFLKVNRYRPPISHIKNIIKFIKKYINKVGQVVSFR